MCPGHADLRELTARRMSARGGCAVENVRQSGSITPFHKVAGHQQRPAKGPRTLQRRVLIPPMVETLPIGWPAHGQGFEPSGTAGEEGSASLVVEKVFKHAVVAQSDLCRRPERLLERGVVPVDVKDQILLLVTEAPLEVGEQPIAAQVVMLGRVLNDFRIHHKIGQVDVLVVGVLAGSRLVRGDIHGGIAHAQPMRPPLVQTGPEPDNGVAGFQFIPVGDEENPCCVTVGAADTGL